MTSTTPGSLYATALFPDMLAPMEIGWLILLGSLTGGIRPAVVLVARQGWCFALFARKRCSGSYYLPRHQATETPFTDKVGQALAGKVQSLPETYPSILRAWRPSVLCEEVVLQRGQRVDMSNINLKIYQCEEL